DTPPGEYTLTASVTDRKSKKTETVSRKFEVLAPDFGIVRMNLAFDPQGQVTNPGAAVRGQVAWIHFAVVGFQRNPGNKQPNISVEMIITDESGKTTMKKPVTGEVSKDVADNIRMIPMSFFLSFNNAGKYKVELKAKDLVSNKTKTETFDVTISDVK